MPRTGEELETPFLTGEELAPAEQSSIVFGPFVSEWDVEQQVIATLRAWMPEYLAEIERKAGLRRKMVPRPPAPESYHGGVDLESWTQDRAPQVIVVVKPQGAPTIRGEGGYNQAYSIEVGCLWVGAGSELAEPPEDEARAAASYMGAATMLLVQHPTLGGLAEQLHMVGAPDTTAPNPDRKDIALCTTKFVVWVSTIVEEGTGPPYESPSEVPGWKGTEEPFPAEPEVQTTHETVTAVAVSKEA